MPSLSEFKNSFTGDLARPNRFWVQIPLPIRSFGEDIIDDSRILTLRCENAQLPGKTFATTEQRTYGPVEKHPYLATYNDIDLTFILADDMRTKKVFDEWLDYVNPERTNDFGYRQDYQTDITVQQYSVADEMTYQTIMYEAFPVSMNQLDLDWANDGYHKLTVTFAYTRWSSITKKGSVIVNQALTESWDDIHIPTPIDW
jgi:hypothetical protein